MHFCQSKFAISKFRENTVKMTILQSNPDLKDSSVTGKKSPGFLLNLVFQKRLINADFSSTKSILRCLLQTLISVSRYFQVFRIFDKRMTKFLRTFDIFNLYTNESTFKTSISAEKA